MDNTEEMVNCTVILWDIEIVLYTNTGTIHSHTFMKSYLCFIIPYIRIFEIDGS